ncbi:MAG: hypothetical protein IKP97_02920 [Kiritimatiellae bacterium]|nr:hypothetical protein [Kiritimatiellia bacterium]
MGNLQFIMNWLNDARDFLNRENMSWGNAAKEILRAVQYDIHLYMGHSKFPHSDVRDKIEFFSGELEIKEFLLPQAMLVAEADAITNRISCAADLNEQDVFLNSCHWGRVVNAMRKELLTNSNTATFHSQYLCEIGYRLGEPSINPKVYTGIESLAQLYADLRHHIVGSDLDSESCRQAENIRDQKVKEGPFEIFRRYIENAGIKVGFLDSNLESDADRIKILESYWREIMDMARKRFENWCNRVRITDISEDFARFVIF